jgi:hypothetical protein
LPKKAEAKASPAPVLSTIFLGLKIPAFKILFSVKTKEPFSPKVTTKALTFISFKVSFPKRRMSF